MSTLERVREKLNEEISRMSQVGSPIDLFSKGRLNGLLFVRDRILYDMKEEGHSHGQES